MGKSKTAQPAKATKAVKDAETPKSKSKELAKQVASKAEKGNKKTKKVVKEPTPESDSESGSDDSDVAMTATSESSESSDEDSEKNEVMPAIKSNGIASNGVAKAANAETSDSSESSDSEADAAPLASTTMKTADSDEDSIDGSGSSSGAESDVESEADSSEDDADVKPGAVDAHVLNGKLEKVVSEQVSSADSDGDSSDAASDSGSDDSSEDSDDDDVEEKPAPSKKRKADTEPAPVAKKPKAEAMASSFDDASKGNLFVGNLSWNVDEDWLVREFEQFGELKNTRVVTDRETGRSRGFGYVEFVNPSDGVKAYNAKKDHMIDGRAINLDFAAAKKEKPAAGGYQERSNKYGDQLNEPSSTIFCANLAFGATEDDVSNAFGEHAPVTAVRIPTDMNTGQAKGFAYVQFGTIEEATTAFDGMKGASINGRSIRIDYASQKPQNGGGGRGGDRGGRGGGRGRGGFDRGGRGGGRGRGGFDRGGRGGGRGGSTNRGGFGDFKGKKMTF